LCWGHKKSTGSSKGGPLTIYHWLKIELEGLVARDFIRKEQEANNILSKIA